MVFNSPFFLYAFLPLTFIAERIARGTKSKNFILIAASLLFYAFGQLKYLPLLIASAAVNWLAGLFIMRVKKGGRLVLTLAVLLNIGVLALYKYVDFFAGAVNSAFGTALYLPGLELPLGISFFTFQGMSYVTDVYREPDSGTKSFSRVLLYIAFFPRLIAGPIVKYGDMAGYMEGRGETPELTLAGLRRFIIGLAKKLLLSAPAGMIADEIFGSAGAAGIDPRLAWLGAVCYTLQLYFDFSGYSDMAIGIADVFGFRIKENFRYPLAAAGIKDFWRRWHISLSAWFRDYIYIPMGGNRKGKLRTFLNRMTVFFVTGLWHGANWTFMVWGVVHGLLSGFEDAGIIPVKKLEKTLAGRVLCRSYTLLAVILLFTVFRAESLSQAGAFLGSMFGGSVTAEGSLALARLLSPASLFFLAVALAAGLLGEKNPLFTAEAPSNRVLRVMDSALVPVLFVLCCLSMAAGRFSPFIYLQF